MPIFVQWKFKKSTFLVILHFLDDFSKPNLRMKEHILQPEGRSMMTWAPSHVEIALFGELLLYANIINGLSEETKMSLIKELQGFTSMKNLSKQMRSEMDGLIINAMKEAGASEDDIGTIEVLHPLYVKEVGRGKKCLLLVNEVTKDIYFCPMLTQGYLDYVKELLKPYT
jgi:hypothetical protein